MVRESGKLIDGLLWFEKAWIRRDAGKGQTVRTKKLRMKAITPGAGVG
jgi:hypothetical protein